MCQPNGRTANPHQDRLDLLVARYHRPVAATQSQAASGGFGDGHVMPEPCAPRPAGRQHRTTRREVGRSGAVATFSRVAVRTQRCVGVLRTIRRSCPSM
jgi:hypothetical protein